MQATAIGTIGYRAGVSAAAATLGFDIVQVLQVAGALRFPVDEVLIYATSFCIVVPFLLEMLALHHVTPEPQRYWTHAALLFALIYAVFVTANYAVQLATVLPAKLSGTVDAIRVLDQTPHSMFWTFDAVGYIAMGLAALLATPALSREHRTVRLALLAHAAVTPLIVVVYFAPIFSTALLFLGFPWAITAPLFMLMLARHLRDQPLAQAPSGSVHLYS